MLILFVDDDIDEYEIFCEAVKTLSATITCLHALDGAQAMRMMQDMDVLPNCIFLDSNMPVMDGRQCLKRIKSESRLTHIPVYVYSTSSNPKEIQAYKDLGALDFIVKPGSFSGLISILKSRIIKGS